jgi:hypothetical protein
MDWQTSMERLYRRKSAERPLAEGDPRKFREAAATLVRRVDPITTGAQALINQQWQDGEYPVWRQRVEDGFIEHQIIRQNPETQQIELVPGKAAWEIIQQFGPEAAYVFLIFAAHATDHATPWQDYIQLKGSELIQLYGWEKRTDLSISTKLEKIRSFVELVCGLSVSISNIDIGKKRYNINTSPMWILESIQVSGPIAPVIDADHPEQQRFAITAPDELEIRVRPGSWVEKFVTGQGEYEQAALRNYGYLAKSTLQINPYRKRLAAKLAIFLTVVSRLYPKGIYQVGELLEAVESSETIEGLKQNKVKRNRLIEQWDKALLTLQELGWEIKFDADYPEELRPNWSVIDGLKRSQARPADWLQGWLQARVSIRPTAMIRHRLEAASTMDSVIPKPTLPNSPAPSETTANKARKIPTVDGTDTERPCIAATAEPQTPLHPAIEGPILARAIALKGISQAKLAEQLGLNRSMITLWLNGSRTIQAKHKALLWQALECELNQAIAELPIPSPSGNTATNP